MKYYCGIDIGGTSAKIGLLNEEGVLLQFKEVSVSFDQYKTPIITTVMNALGLFLADIPVMVEGIGVSAAGQIDVQTGTVMGTCGNLPNYIGSDFKSEIMTRFRLPSTVVNDANCMILGENWLGAARGHQNVIGITIGTGIGGGILVNGDILNGSYGLAGEVGHMILHHNGLPCTCGNHGCYEQYASMTALIRLVTQNAPFSGPINGRTIFERLDQDELLRKTLDEWIDCIVAGLVSLIHIFNPTLIIIGGGVSVQDRWLIDPIREKILDQVMPRFADHLETVAAQLGNQAGLIGAVSYFIRHQTK